MRKIGGRSVINPPLIVRAKLDGMPYMVELMCDFMPKAGDVVQAKPVGNCMPQDVLVIAVNNGDFELVLETL
jgi:hypothetical protein